MTLCFLLSAKGDMYVTPSLSCKKLRCFPGKNTKNTTQKTATVCKQRLRAKQEVLAGLSSRACAVVSALSQEWPLLQQE